MAKPSFPVFPEVFLKKKPPMSGICPSKTKQQLFLLTIPISLALGVAAHYLGYILGIMGAGWLTMTCDDVTGIVSWVCIGAKLLGMGFNLILLAYSILIGALVVEGIVGRIAERGHCRNPRLAGWAGVLSAFTVYTGHLAITWFSQKGLQPFVFHERYFEIVFNTTITGTPWWLYGLIGLEFVVLVLFAALEAADHLKNMVYCEIHEAWYEDWKSGSFPFGIAFSIIESFKTHDVSSIHKFSNPDAEGYPRVEVKMRGCPKGSTCDMEMVGTFYWQEIKQNNKGETSISIQNEQWFDLMVNAVFGNQMDQALRLKAPLPPEKKKSKSQKTKVA